jgi:hypothetical protein
MNTLYNIHETHLLLEALYLFHRITQPIYALLVSRHALEHDGQFAVLLLRGQFCFAQLPPRRRELGLGVLPGQQCGAAAKWLPGQAVGPKMKPHPSCVRVQL